MLVKNVIDSSKESIRDDIRHNSTNTIQPIHTHTTLYRRTIPGGQNIMKQYSLRCSYCGSTIKKYEPLLKLHFIFFKSYTLNCPICHKKSRWITHFILKHDQDQHERIFNKSKLFDDRI